MADLPLYLALGLFCGLCAIYFIRMTLALEDRMGKIGNPYLRWIISAAGLGLLIFFFRPLHGEGYNFLGPMLSGEDIPQYITKPWAIPLYFLAVLLLKVFSMTFTNAGGGVGGTFGPTLFMGGMAGFVLAGSINLFWPGTVPASNFVLLGMAGLMAGVMQAPLTAIFLIAEISQGYDHLYIGRVLRCNAPCGEILNLYEANSGKRRTSNA